MVEDFDLAGEETGIDPRRNDEFG